MSGTNLRSLDREEYKQLVTNLESKCIDIERVGIAVNEKDGTLFPSIRINERLYEKLACAGSIDVTSVIDTTTAGSHFYVVLKLSWKTINEKLVIYFNGWRDRSWLELLCAVRKVALAKQDFEVAKPLHQAIVVDGFKVDRLKVILATTMCFYPPRDYPFEDEIGADKNVKNNRLLPQ